MDRLQPAFPIGLDVIGEDGVHQPRHVARDVVKHVRLLKIVELVPPSDETSRGKTPGREKGEKHVVRHEPWSGNNAPAGRASENVAEPAKIRNAVRGDTELLEAIEVFAAGAPLEQFLLTLEQQAPDRVLVLGIGLPVLLDCMVRQPAAHRVLDWKSTRLNSS